MVKANNSQEKIQNFVSEAIKKNEPVTFITGYAGASSLDFLALQGQVKKTGSSILFIGMAQEGLTLNQKAKIKFLHDLGWSIFVPKGEKNHSKISIINNKMAILGSSNLDSLLGLGKNKETDMMFCSKENTMQFNEINQSCLSYLGDSSPIDVTTIPDVYEEINHNENGSEHAVSPKVGAEIFLASTAEETLNNYGPSNLIGSYLAQNPQHPHKKFSVKMKCHPQSGINAHCGVPRNRRLEKGADGKPKKDSAGNVTVLRAGTPRPYFEFCLPISTALKSSVSWLTDGFPIAPNLTGSGDDVLVICDDNGVKKEFLACLSGQKGKNFQSKVLTDMGEAVKGKLIKTGIIPLEDWGKAVTPSQLSKYGNDSLSFLRIPDTVIKGKSVRTFLMDF